jgi:hypothetical protein
VRHAEGRVSITTSQSLGVAHNAQKFRRLLAASEPSGAEAAMLDKSASRSVVMMLSFLFCSLVGSHKALCEVRENVLA